MSRTRTLILGAAGRDFHDFNTVYRDDPGTEVVAFTAAQIPGIGARRYPASLAGALYPDGIPIHDEADLEQLCRHHAVARVVFAYSDVSHEHVMHRASTALACGADFELLGPGRTMLASALPVVAVSAVRTGCGKSQVARWLSRRLREAGWRVAVLRHPMPYGDLEAQRVQRFATPADLARGRCTLEEREEYEPHIELGNVVFAGVDYADVLVHAQREADILVWDGGNNDFPFVRPDLHLVVTDALRPGQLATHHPGEAVLRMADVAIVNKANAVPASVLEAMEAAIRAINPRAGIVRANSMVRLDDPAVVKGRRVLVVEDGPTITHGGMPHGAGLAAALAGGAAQIVDPRASASASIAALYAQYPHIGPVLPAMGYGPEQLASLLETIDGSSAECVVAGTPIDLAALLPLGRPVVRARYGFSEPDGQPLAGTLAGIVDAFVARLRAQGRGPGVVTAA